MDMSYKNALLVIIRVEVQIARKKVIVGLLRVFFNSSQLAQNSFYCTPSILRKSAIVNTGSDCNRCKSFHDKIFRALTSVAFLKSSPIESIEVHCSCNDQNIKTKSFLAYSKFRVALIQLAFNVIIHPVLVNYSAVKSLKGYSPRWWQV